MLHRRALKARELRREDVGGVHGFAGARVDPAARFRYLAQLVLVDFRQDRAVVRIAQDVAVCVQLRQLRAVRPADADGENRDSGFRRLSRGGDGFAFLPLAVRYDDYSLLAGAVVRQAAKGYPDRFFYVRALPSYHSRIGVVEKSPRGG